MKITNLSIATLMISIAFITGFLVFQNTKKSQELTKYQVTGNILNYSNLYKGSRIYIDWVSDPIPYCDALVVQYVRNMKTNKLWHIETNVQTAWGHTNFINGPNNKHISSDNKIHVVRSYHLPNNLPEGTYEWHIKYQFYCSILDRIFPAEIDLKLFEFNVTGD